MIPIAKKSGSTVFGVRIGCHAFNRCCRKAVSVLLHQHVFRRTLLAAPNGLAGLLLFCFFSGSSLSLLLLASVCSIVCDMVVVSRQFRPERKSVCATFRSASRCRVVKSASATTTSRAMASRIHAFIRSYIAFGRNILRLYISLGRRRIAAVRHYSMGTRKSGSLFGYRKRITFMLRSCFILKSRGYQAPSHASVPSTTISNRCSERHAKSLAS